MESIILLHGALGDEYQLQRLADLLEPNYKCYTVNFYGHGDDSKNESPFSIGNFSKQIREFILANNLVGAPIFGYSMGGLVAMHLARFYPSLPGKIVTYGTQYNWSIANADKELTHLNPDAILEKVPTYADLLKTRHGRNWIKVLERTAQTMLEMGVRNPIGLTDYPNIKHEVLILRGSRDAMVSGKYSKEIANFLPNGTYQELEGQPHPIEKVDCNLIKEAIESFLR